MKTGIDRAWSFSDPYIKIWNLMSTIQFIHFYQPKNDPVDFKYFADDGNSKIPEPRPKLDEMPEILFALQSFEAIDIEREIDNTYSKRSFPVEWILKVNNPRFKEVSDEAARLAGITTLMDPEDTQAAEEIVQFLPGQTVAYQNQVLFFKLGDNTSDSIDFSGADILRNIFESFWELRKRETRPDFKPQEVITMYKELFKKDIEPHYLAGQVSNIRTKKINPKQNLKERFKIDFDRDSQTWIFILS